MMGASNTSKKSSHTTPRVGATYSFNPKVHGFVGYGEAVQTPYLTNFAAGVSPTPEKMKQIEYGVKFKDFYGVNGTVSVLMWLETMLRLQTELGRISLIRVTRG